MKKSFLKSTEIKIALFALSGLFLLVWGINFLKGIDIFKPQHTYYVVFEKTAGLLPAHTVTVRGMNVGIVDEIQLMPDKFNNVIVALKINKTLQIPINSIARIATTNPLSAPQVEIVMGDETHYFQDGDTITGLISAGIMDGLGGLVANIDTVVILLKETLQSDMLPNLKETVHNFRMLTQRLDKLVADNSPKVNTILSDVQSLTTTIHTNEGKIENVIDNLNTLSNDLAESELKQTIDSLSLTLQHVNTTLNHLNQGDGTLGQLLTNDSVYIDLHNSLLNLDKLLIDIKANPKRYINITVFGKKEKKN
jgi:phospholipid/cholesterol/gamma-HCH transport system substrate-binding protein